MKKSLAVLCCALAGAASIDHYLHRHHVLQSKHYKPPAIAVKRTEEALIIINLQTHRRLPSPAGQLAGKTLDRPWAAALLAAIPAHTTPWPGFAGRADGEPIAVSAVAGAGNATAALNKDRLAEPAAAPIDIGNADVYAQLKLGRPCRTIAHCNWLGAQAIRDGMPHKAVRPFRTALKLATQQHNRPMMLISYYNIAIAYWWMKHYKQAAAWAKKGLAAWPPTALAGDRHTAAQVREVKMSNAAG